MSSRIPILLLVPFLAAVLSAAPGVIAQTTMWHRHLACSSPWYVDDDAPNDPSPGDPSNSDPLEDGSPEHPFDAIQEAIDAATGGDEVLVLDGTYTGSGNRDLNFAGTAITVRSEHGPDTCIIDCEGSNEDPHRGFHFHRGETAQTVVDGFTIQNGLANASLPGGARGGGMHITGSNPTITHCKFAENGVGTLDYSDNFGGGIYCTNNSNPALTGCSFRGNSAAMGAGMYNETSSPMLTDCTFIENFGASGGGGIYNADNSNPMLVRCAFTRNRTTIEFWPWNMLGTGGGMCNAAGSSPTLVDCTFTENWATIGGGMGNREGSSPILINCSFIRNWVSNPVLSEFPFEFGGGGMYIGDFCSAILTNCIFSGNMADRYGGGIHVEDDSSVTLANCSFRGNTAGRIAGAIRVQGNSTASLYNCILWDDSAPQGPEIALIDDDGPATLTVSYSDVQGGEAAVHVDAESTLIWGDGNIDADPHFTRADPHLLADSPCIGAGDPDFTPDPGATDLDGEPRIDEGRLDMGADEFTDEDADGLPDWFEQLHFGSPTAGDPAADEDEDGRTNLDEYARSTSPFRAPATYHVNVNGNDEWDGLSPVWDGKHGPKATIQAAVDVADRYEGDTVIVAAGTYSGDGNRDIDFAGRVITVRGTDPSDPDVVAATVINCQGTEEDRHRGFTFQSGEDAEARIAGLTVINGAGPLFGPEEQSHRQWLGGAVYCHGSSPTIANCRFMWNATPGSSGDYGSGGAVYCRHSSATIINCLINGNVASRWGAGGIHCEANSDATITHCTITGNSTDYGYGGGIGCSSASNPRISHCTIAGNDTGDWLIGGTAVKCGEGAGGGVYCDSSSPLIVNCAIVGNKGGGWMFEYQGGGGIACDRSDAIIRGCTIAGNAACDGGGVVCTRSTLSVLDCILWDDTAVYDGPEIALAQNSTLWVSYSDVQHGQAGLYVHPNSDLIWGDGNLDADPMFLGGPAGAWTADGVYDALTRQVTFTDQEAAWGEGELIGRFVNPDTEQYLQFLIIANTAATITVWADWSTLDDDASWVTARMAYQIHDYHLTVDSPCVDAGDPAFVVEEGETDIDGDDRVRQCRVDIGADESPFFADCNANALPDACEVAEGTSEDYDLDGVPDECQDCNANGIPDGCDLDCGVGNCALHPLGCGRSQDIDGSGVPDECEEWVWCVADELVELTASDGAADDEFGRSVAVSGDIAVIGTPLDDDNGYSSGSAYVFRFDGTEWTEEAKLTASDGAAEDWFGSSVAISGDITVIGAPGDDDDGNYSGAAYVFRLDGADWVEEAKLTASDGAEWDSFGNSVAVSGDTVVVGAYGDDDNGYSSVSAYVFRFDGIRWVEEARLTAPDAAPSDEFGRSVAISGTTTVIGVPGDDDTGDDSGSAYVFEKTGSVWSQKAKLTASDGALGDCFGHSVAVSGDTAVIGAYLDDDNGYNSGSAYVFRVDPGAPGDWIEEAKLTAFDPAAYDWFGRSVAISGDTAVIGACHNDDDGADSGSAYVFGDVGGAWRQRAKLTASDAAADDLFGLSVAVWGDIAVVGALYADGNTTGSGSAYVFRGLADCNTDEFLDLCDIAGGRSQDCNGTGIPDECECCPGDANGDGAIDASDIQGFVGALLAPPVCGVDQFDEFCRADVNHDGAIDLADVEPFVERLLESPDCAMP